MGTSCLLLVDYFYFDSMTFSSEAVYLLNLSFCSNHLSSLSIQHLFNRGLSCKKVETLSSVLELLVRAPGPVFSPVAL